MSTENVNKIYKTVCQCK